MSQPTADGRIFILDSISKNEDSYQEVVGSIRLLFSHSDQTAPTFTMSETSHPTAVLKVSCASIARFLTIRFNNKIMPPIVGYL